MVRATAQMRERGRNFRTFLSAKIAGVAVEAIAVCFTALTGRMQTESITNTRITHVNCQTCQRWRNKRLCANLGRWSDAGERRHDPAPGHLRLFTAPLLCRCGQECGWKCLLRRHERQ